MMNKKIKSQIKEEGYLHYFDKEMYLIILLSYFFGFLAGWGKNIFLFLSFFFLAYPFYLKYLKDKREVSQDE